MISSESNEKRSRKAIKRGPQVPSTEKNWAKQQSRIQMLFPFFCLDFIFSSFVYKCLFPLFSQSSFVLLQ